jgi:alkanesulfonate monooxygenase SsuD/methylene tetrahydromethanopterin reductase-like flavin-dependent oxidoreductase (luciferase family)
VQAVPDYRHDLQFGAFIVPVARQADAVVELSRLADVAGLDIVSFQDHPYQSAFLDTWTLLSVVAAATTNVRVAPNVANLPLRPPVTLARSAASLDILSGGRVELGIGAGTYHDALVALGLPRLTAGQSVDALAEAVDVIRAIWRAEGPVHHDGTHFQLDGVESGPPPAHDIEIWLGAYKPRMLRLTGAKADGWLPSQGYIDMEKLPELNARIDAAAEEAGRAPEAIRRMLNINGSLGAEQLAELTLSTGMSAYILMVSSADDLQRFAEEVAPATRELVADARGRPTAEAPRGPVVLESPPPLAVAPTPGPERRLSDESAWDESTRPTGPARDPSRSYSAREQAAGRHLIDVHDALRAELAQLRDLVGQVAAGTSNAAAVRSFITRMTIRQNNWTLGTFCETYCRTVTNHHTLEDRSVFPHLRRSDEGLGPVIDRLEEEHEQIADLLERVDSALVALVAAEEDGIGGVGRAMDLLTDALLSHFSYEERELVEPLARHGFY